MAMTTPQNILKQPLIRAFSITGLIVACVFFLQSPVSFASEISPSGRSESEPSLNASNINTSKAHESTTQKSEADTNTESPTPLWNGRDRKLNTKDMRLYEKDFFRIFYYTDGTNKVDPADKDNNNIPDYVEDISKQFWASHRIFCGVFGFQSPLGAPYYKDVTSIDIFILSSNSMRGTLGMAFSSPIPAPLKKKGELSLRVFVSKGFDFRLSSTVPHEYFHLIQNGMSRIRNKWYFEGLARWAENSLTQKQYYVDPNWDYQKILNSKNGLIYLQSLSYKNGGLFWVPLSRKFGEGDNITLAKDDPLRTLRYSDNSPVLRDTHFTGGTFMRLFLKELHKADRRIEKDFNLSAWNAEQSTLRRNNIYIIEALKTSTEIYEENNEKD